MRSIAEYEEVAGFSCPAEEFVCLEGTRLVYSDPLAFSRDVLSPRESYEPKARLEEVAESVLLSAGSVISRPHTLDNPVHEPPSTTGKARVGYRPPRYGRAGIFDLCDGSFDTQGEVGKGLFEVKGCGVATGTTPDVGGTRTGVLFMHEALIEVITHVLLSRLFQRDQATILRAVRFYAVVDIGVRARVAWARNPLPCATVVRECVIRPPDNNELPLKGSEEEAVHHRIECNLLSHGLTTTGPITTLTMVKEGSRLVARLNGEIVPELTEEIIFLHLKSLGLTPPQIFHFANVQIARACSLEPLQACLVDLGHIRAREELAGHLAVFVRDRPLNWGITTLKGGAQWPQRVKRGAIDQHVFGPRLTSEGEMFEQVVEWLQPTESFQKVSEGVVWEALRLTMLLDKGACSAAQLAREIDDFVDRSCLGRESAR